MEIDNSQFTLNAYEARAKESDQFPNDRASIDQLRYGFFGEVGGLLAAVKKANRDSFAPDKREMALEELGDALWYLSALARRFELTLNAVGEEAIHELQYELQICAPTKPSGDITFDEVDGLLAFHTKRLPEPKDVLLYKLAHHTSTMFWRHGDSADLVSATHLEVLAKLLSSLAMVSAKFGLRLSEIAVANNKKTEFRWASSEAKYIDLFDKDSLPLEQLPRNFEIQFIERKVNGKTFVIQQRCGVNIGDPLTDNRQDGDDYRFHDVFHLAYIAHLGWSPVIRALMKLKRKSDPHVDENQDGARAIIIEEGIATWIFNHARDRDYYKNVQKGKLEYGLLKQVQSMVSGYEVDKCPLWQWENAILEGFAVFRSLRDAKCGVVSVDMNKHLIEFRPLTEKNNEC